MLAFGVVALSSGPRPLFDDGRDFATCSSLENAHLRYLWANCDGWVALRLRGSAPLRFLPVG